MSKECIERAYIMGWLTAAETQKRLKAMTGDEVYAEVLGAINNAPAADVVEVPDCKKCLRYEDMEKWDFCEHCIGNTYKNNAFVAKEEI